MFSFYRVLKYFFDGDAASRHVSEPLKFTYTDLLVIAIKLQTMPHTRARKHAHTNKAEQSFPIAFRSSTYVIECPHRVDDRSQFVGRVHVEQGVHHSTN